MRFAFGWRRVPVLLLLCGAALAAACGVEDYKFVPEDEIDAGPDAGPPPPATPTVCGSACTGGGSGQPCQAVDGIVPITSIQTLTANAACNGSTVTVKGIVTGVDDLYGSTYDAIYKSDAGFWLQNATRDPQATTSSALFVEAVQRPADIADFIGREDGLAGLSRAYGLHPRSVRPLAPALKYQALAAGSVDVVDGYSTDGLLDRYGLVVLADDRHFFPPYEAAALLGPRAAGRADVVAALSLLSGHTLKHLAAGAATLPVLSALARLRSRRQNGAPAAMSGEVAARGWRDA